MSDVEILTIGSELLSGAVPNCNATYLCDQLTRLGYTVRGCHVLGSHRSDLRSAFDRVLRERSLVIATGGLGPDTDDYTKEVVAQIFDSSFRFDDGVAAALKERYGEDLATLQHEATVPSKATVIPNALGTAPALLFEALTVTLILLPGTPAEMQSVFTKSIRPYLRRRIKGGRRTVSRTLLLSGVSARDILADLRDIQSVVPMIQYEVYSMPALLRVTLRVRGEEDAALEIPLIQVASVLAERYSDVIVNTGDETLQAALHRLFVEKQLTLSVAESCTGGALAATLTSQPGASQYFLGGAVAYSNEVKKSILSVGDPTLEAFGAVSQEVAKEMATGVLNQTGSDYSVAVTGVAGPEGGSPDKPVGTVWLAIAGRGGWVHAWMIRGHGTRAQVIEAGINAVLGRLWQLVSHDIGKSDD